MTGARLVGDVGPRREVVPLPVLVHRWVEEGLVSAEQARALEASGGPPEAGRPGLPLLAEALAYVGGAVVAAGSGLLGAYYWDDLTAAWRFLALATAAAALIGLGAAVPHHLAAAGRRMRAVLWVAATVVFTGAATVLVTDVVAADRFSAEAEPVLVTAASATLAAVLWARLRHGLQQAAFLVAVAALAGATLAWADLAVEPGAGVWLVGLAWAVLGLTGRIVPAETPLVLGAAAAIFGTMTAANSDAGMVFVLLTIAAVVAVASLRRDLLLLALGALATLVNVPAAMSRWFAGSVAAALALVAVGVLLVAVAVWMTRDRSRRREPVSRRSWGVGA